MESDPCRRVRSQTAAVMPRYRTVTSNACSAWPANWFVTAILTAKVPAAGGVPVRTPVAGSIVSHSGPSASAKAFCSMSQAC